VIIHFKGADILTRIEKSIEIKAQRDKVWEMLAFDRHPEWFEERENAAYTSEVRTPEDKYRVGASAQVTEKHFGKFNVEITESIEKEKIMYLLRGIPHSKNVIEIISLKPTEIGTKVTFVADGEVPNPIYWILEKLFVHRAMEKGTEKSLEKLKSILEK
jgi:uncharacterized protein YndB with AHSA1/START domain